MQEASPNDVQGVLDAIDVLIISGGISLEEMDTLPEPHEHEEIHGVSAATLKHVAEEYMRRNRISLEQLTEIGRRKQFINSLQLKILNCFG